MRGVHFCTCAGASLRSRNSAPLCCIKLDTATELTSNGGKLLSEKDEYNNTITYTYTDGNVTSITDGSGRVTTITYYTKSNGDKRVSKITRPDGKNIVFSYTDSEFDKI